MNKRTMHIIEIIFKIIQSLGPIMMIAGFIWMLGIAGTSDFESEIGEVLHSDSWYIINGLKALCLSAIGFGCSRFAYPIYCAIRKANNKHMTKRYAKLNKGNTL